MTQRPALALVLVIAFLAAAAGTYGQAPSSEEKLSGFDAGPQEIDVSSYPTEMQEKYELFAARCTSCHTLARPINSDYALPDEWSRYVKRMMRKPGSGITPKDGKAIYEFLVYDSTIRKAELIREKEQANTDG